MLNIITALPCESKPIVGRLKMKPAGHCGRVQLFEGDGVRLATCGVGSIQSAIGTTALGIKDRSPGLWLNIGICGHGSGDIGSLWIANKITSDRERDAYFPQPIETAKIPGCQLHTVSEPERNYADSISYDMEGFGFYRAATHFATCESVHCLKTVTDNPSAPVSRKFEKSWVSDLVEASLDRILLFAEANAPRPKPSTNWISTNLDRIEASLHTTATQREQLKKALACLNHLSDQACAEDAIPKARNAKQLINDLRDRINEIASTHIA